MTTRQSRAATAQSMNRRFSVSQQRDAHQVQQHVHNRLEHVKPRKVKIDGFRFGDEKSTGPFAWQITTPVKYVLNGYYFIFISSLLNIRRKFDMLISFVMKLFQYQVF
jgi:hypothetical protein